METRAPLMKITLSKRGEEKLKRFNGWLKEKNNIEAIVRSRERPIFVILDGEYNLLPKNLYNEIFRDALKNPPSKTHDGYRYVKIDFTFDENITPYQWQYDNHQGKYGILKIGEEEILYFFLLNIEDVMLLEPEDSA